MKVLKLSLIGLSVLLFFGCKKGEEQNLSTTTSDPSQASQLLTVQTTNCLGYDFQLNVDKTSQPGYTIFVWTITNPNPGNGTNGTIQNLSHWDFTPGQCLTDNWQAVKEAAYNLGSGWQTISPLPTLQVDPAMAVYGCETGNVFKFAYGTTGDVPSQYKLVLEGKWGTGDLDAYFKSGNKTKCCHSTFTNMGVGCKEEDACSYSQGYWFSTNAQHPNGVHPWPDPGTVTIGGQSYTNAEGLAIWNASTQGGLTDAQAAFTQLAAIRLSKVDEASIPALSAAAAIIDNWLSHYGDPKLTTSNLRNQRADEKAAYGDAKAAAGVISDWINANHCQ